MHDHSTLARVTAEGRAAGPDILDEAQAVYQAAIRLGGRGWRTLYLAHFAAEHPMPSPREAGVLQVGDPVMRLDARGAEDGPGRVTGIAPRDLGDGRVGYRVRYLLDAAGPSGEPRMREAASNEVVHANAWAEALLTYPRPFHEVRPGGHVSAHAITADELGGPALGMR